MSPIWKTAMTALTLTAAITITAPAGAGPVPGNLATLSATAPRTVTDVRWRGGGAVAAGIAAGVITGAIIAGSANSYYYGPGPYYYGPAYYYGPSYYVPPPYYVAPPYYGPRRYYYYREPVYVAPPYYDYGPRGVYRGPRGRCWISTDNHRGYGYWGPC